MRLWNLCFITVVLPSCLLAADGDGRLEWDASSWSYLHNLEFTSKGARYQVGETYFGEQLAVIGLYRRDGLTLRCGVLLDVTFGDDPDAIHDSIEPIIGLDWRRDGEFGFRFGNLDQRDHELHPALYFPVLRHQRPSERGFETHLRRGALNSRTWIQWRRRNTEDSREHFDVGFVATAERGPVGGEVQVHGMHWGGQLFDHGVVSDNWGLSTGAVWSPNVSIGPLGTPALSCRAFYSYDMTDRELEDARSGHGIEVRFETAWAGWTLHSSRWSGDSLLAGDGHPFYRSDRFTAWGFGREWVLADLATAGLGFIGYHLDDSFEQEFWLVVEVPTLLAH